MKKKSMKILVISAASILTIGSITASAVVLTQFGKHNSNKDKDQGLVPGEGPGPSGIPEGPGHTDKTVGFPYINEAVAGTGDHKYDNHVPQNAKVNSEFYQKSASWYDSGFMWYELLARPWYDSPGVPSADGSTFMDKMLGSQNMFNMGFITGYNAKATAEKIKAEPTNEYAQLLKKEADANPDVVVPSISGTLSPVIMTNAYNWDGSKTLNVLDAIRAKGGDFKISFGGWNNYSIAAAEAIKNRDEATSVESVYKSYKAVVDATNARYLDFDIEGLENGKTDDWGNTPLNPAQQVSAKKIRIQAIKKLKKDYPKLNVTFTLPTDLGKLASVPGYSGEQMITDAFNEGVLNSVNIMAFDYGKNDVDLSGNPRLTTPGEGALYSISSMNSLYETLRKMDYFKAYTNEQIWGVIDVTTMNGRSDVRYQVNWETDAKIIANFAIDKHIGGLYTWSSQKDISQFARDDYSKDMSSDYKAGYTPNMKIYVDPLTIDQLMNYKDLGVKKTIIGKDGKAWDINAAMTSGVGAKDFVYTKIINNYGTKTKSEINPALLNKAVFANQGITNFGQIENFSGVLKSSLKYNGTIDSIYNGFINLERSDTAFYFK